MTRSPRRFFLLLVLLVVPTFSMRGLSQAHLVDGGAAAEASPTPDARWSVGAPAYRLGSVVGADSELYQVVDVPGWLLGTQPGRPALPYTTTLVVLPPTGSVQLDIDAGTESAIPLSSPVFPAPQPVERNAAIFSDQPTTSWALDRSIYDGDDVFPSERVTFSEIGIFRGLRLGRLTVYPFRYDPANRRLMVSEDVVVTLQFDEPFGPLSGVSTDLDPLHAGLRSFVLNPQALSAGVPSAVSVAAGTEATLLSSSDWGQFPVVEAGLYSVSWQRLVDAGIVPIAGDPDQVHIWRAATATEIATAWEADRQQFVFYAHPIVTRWADYEMYRVSYAETPGLRMAPRACGVSWPHHVYLPLVAAADQGLTQTPVSNIWVAVSAEENHGYDSLYTSPRDGQSWYWQCLQQPPSATCSTEMAHTVQLASPSAGGEAQLSLWAQGYTRTEHRIQIFVNDHSVGVASWTGKQALVERFWFPAAYLQDGANLIRLKRLGDGIGGAWIDAFELRHDIAAVGELPLRFTGQATPATYPLRGVEETTAVYEVTNPDVPARVTGCLWAEGELRVGDDRAGPLTYLLSASSDVQAIADITPLNALVEPAGADYIAIAPQSWLDELQPLLTHREAQGLTTFAVPLEALYDVYGDGRQDPAAIQAFVSHAYHTWVPKPLYLLLVGDGTWDPLDYLGTGTPTWLPPYLVDVDPWMGEVPADNRYAAVDGDDVLPDLAVGRLPVNSAVELTETVSKILNYELDASISLWKLRHLFVVDNSDGVNDFSGSAAIVQPLAPLTHTVTTLEMPGSGVDTLTSQREQLFYDLDQGALVVSWIGHSSWQQWEHRRLFHTDDLYRLSQGDRLPLVLEMTCFTSNFAHPEPQHTAMDEALVRLPEAGAVATWGSSGGGLDDAHQTLHRGLYQSLFGASSPRVGEATLMAKLTLASDAAHLVDTFHLFGDPALVLQSTDEPYVVYIPIVAQGGASMLYLPMITR